MECNHGGRHLRSMYDVAAAQMLDNRVNDQWTHPVSLGRTIRGEVTSTG